jgi:transcriptional regulator with XRE-family HTH domain
MVKKKEINIIAERLLALRLENKGYGEKLSQVNLGKQLGISQAAVTSYENGLRIPTIEILVRYADYFNTSLDYILGRTDYEMPNSQACIDLNQLEKFRTVLFNGNKINDSDISKIKDLLQILFKE